MNFCNIRIAYTLHEENPHFMSINLTESQITKFKND